MRCEIRIAFPCNSSSYQVVLVKAMPLAVTLTLFFIYLLISNFPQGNYWKRLRNLFVVAFSIFVEQKPDRSLNQRASSISYVHSTFSSRLSYHTATLKHTQDPSETCGVRKRKKIGELILFYVYYFKL